MSKYITLLIILFNLYYCSKPEEVETFLINPNLVKEKDLSIEIGKEFCIKIPTFISSYVLLNKKENADTIPLKKTDSYTEHYKNENLGGRRGYLLYYFKANAATKEPRLLKFTDTYSYLREKDPKPKLIVKVSVIGK